MSSSPARINIAVLVQRVLRDHHGRKFRKARWSPSEPYLATIHARDVWIWDMRLTERPCTIFSAPGSFNTADIDWSPKNSEKLISTNAAGVMHVWSSRSPRAPVASQYVHRSTLASYSKDGNAVLAFGEPGTTFRVLDASNLSRVYELPIHSSKVKAFDFVQRRKYNSSALAVLQDNSSVSAVEIPHKEIRKCKGDQDSPAFPFRDGIFKGSLQNNFAYSILEFPTVIRERERSSETSFGMHESTSDSSLVKMPLNSIVGGTAPKPASEGEGYFLESGRGPPRCAVSFSSQGARAIFSVQEGEISETLSSTNPTISNSPRLTYFLTGDEHLHISVEEGEDAREASKKLLSAYLDSSRTKRTVEVVRLSENLKHVFQNSMASAYEILRDTSEELTWKEAAAACRTNAEVADKHSEAEIASMWRLAAVAFQEKPDQCIFARMLLLEIAMQLDARYGTRSSSLCFFSCYSMSSLDESSQLTDARCFYAERTRVSISRMLLRSSSAYVPQCANPQQKLTRQTFLVSFNLRLCKRVSKFESCCDEDESSETNMHAKWKVRCTGQHPAHAVLLFTLVACPIFLFNYSPLSFYLSFVLYNSITPKI